MRSTTNSAAHHRLWRRWAMAFGLLCLLWLSRYLPVAAQLTPLPQVSLAVQPEGVPPPPPASRATVLSGEAFDLLVELRCPTLTGCRERFFLPLPSGLTWVERPAAEVALTAADGGLEITLRDGWPPGQATTFAISLQFHPLTTLPATQATLQLTTLETGEKMGNPVAISARTTPQPNLRWLPPAFPITLTASHPFVFEYCAAPTLAGGLGLEMATADVRLPPGTRVVAAPGATLSAAGDSLRFAALKASDQRCLRQGMTLAFDAEAVSHAQPPQLAVVLNGRLLDDSQLPELEALLPLVTAEGVTQATLDLQPQHSGESQHIQLLPSVTAGERVTITVALPDSFRLQGWSSGWLNAASDVTVSYRQAGSPDWRLWTVWRLRDAATQRQGSLSDLLLEADAPLSHVRFVYADFGPSLQPAAAPNSLLTLDGDLDGAAEGLCAVLKVDAETPLERCATLTADPALPLEPGLNLLTPGPHKPGDELHFELRLSGRSLRATPHFGVELPPGLLLVPDSWQQISSGPLPQLTLFPAVTTTDPTLLRWSWPREDEPGFDDQLLVVDFRARLSADFPPGAQSVRWFGQAASSNTPFRCWGHPPHQLDHSDLNRNGRSDDHLCTGAVEMAISPQAAIETQVRARVGVDPWLPVGAAADAYPLAPLQVEVTLTNTGNVPFKRLNLLQGLPALGDRHPLTGAAQGSTWQPLLSGPVEVPPGMSVFYTAVDNPCGLDGGDKTACTPADWTTILPTDPTGVRGVALKIDQPLQPGEELTVRLALVAPARLPRTHFEARYTLAWRGQRADNGRWEAGATSPLPLRSAPTPAGALGGQVWLDANADGLQNDMGEGVNSVGVALIDLGPDRLLGTADDDTVARTLTLPDATGAAGHYQFSSVPEGQYALQVFPPLTTTLAPRDRGAETLDSDAYSGSGRTDFFEVRRGAQDLHWDFGLVPRETGTLHSYVWGDLNQNGLQDDPVSAGLNGIMVNVYESRAPGEVHPGGIDGRPLMTLETTDDIYGRPGYLMVPGLDPQRAYYLELLTPHPLTAVGVGGNQMLDSDAQLQPEGQSGARYTPPVFVPAGTLFDQTDIGLQPSGVDLSLTHTQPARILAGETFSWTLQLANIGSGAATGVVVEQSLPPGLRAIGFELSPSGRAQGVRCFEEEGRFWCTAEQLDAAADISMAVEGVLDSTVSRGVLHSRAMVHSSAPEANLGNNGVQPRLSVGTEANLHLTQTLPNSVSFDEYSNWEIEIDNLGPSAAHGMVVTTTIPSGVEFQGGVGLGWTCGEMVPRAREVSCRYTELVPALEAAELLRLTVYVPFRYPHDRVSSQSRLTAATLDRYIGNNYAQALSYIAYEKVTHIPGNGFLFTHVRYADSLGAPREFAGEGERDFRIDEVIPYLFQVPVDLSFGFQVTEAPRAATQVCTTPDPATCFRQDGIPGQTRLTGFTLERIVQVIPQGEGEEPLRQILYADPVYIPLDNRLIDSDTRAGCAEQRCTGFEKATIDGYAWTPLLDYVRLWFVSSGGRVPDCPEFERLGLPQRCIVIADASPGLIEIEGTISTTVGFVNQNIPLQYGYYGFTTTLELFAPAIINEADQ